LKPVYYTSGVSYDSFQDTPSVEGKEVFHLLPREEVEAGCVHGRKARKEVIKKQREDESVCFIRAKERRKVYGV
jgi:hypothetical protein